MRKQTGKKTERRRTKIFGKIDETDRQRERERFCIMTFEYYRASIYKSL